MKFNNRWYDANSKVKLAVDCIETANQDLKHKLAKLIIKNAMDMKVTAKDKNPGFFRSWCDKEPNVRIALEYFKNCNDKQRLEISEHIFLYIKGESHNII